MVLFALPYSADDAVETEAAHPKGGIKEVIYHPVGPQD